MPPVLYCPQCNSTNFQLIENNRCKCNVCGTIFSVPETEQADRNKIPESPENKSDKNPVVSIVLGVILMGGIFAYGVMSVNKSVRDTVHNVKENIMDKMDDNDVKPKYTESTQSFLAVPGKEGAEIWLIKRRNSSDLQEVDYRISIENPMTRKELFTRPVISTITWDQSFDKNFQIGKLKRAGSRCWLIIGGKSLVGYDIASRQKTVDNDILSAQFHQFSEGISYVDDLVNVAGFKVTSEEGITYYYLPEDNKVLTEVEYDNVRRNENTNITNWAFQTQYVFSQEHPQKLYKLIRRQQNLRMRKIYPEEVQQILDDESLWYRKMYNVVSMEEFTPGKTYFNGNVLYNDNDYCVLISTADSSSEGPIIIQCMDKNRKLLWADLGNEAQEFEPFLKAGYIDAFRKEDELIIQVPYQVALAVNIHTGKITWKYKLTEVPS